jgi:hypothetical protein
MSRKKKPKIDFPIFSIHGNYLEDDVNEAVELRATITELNEHLDIVNKEMKNIGNKVDLYLNNIIKREIPFDYKEDMIIFTGENEICFYPHDIIEEYLDGEDEIIPEEMFELLPPTDDKHILNDKQIIRCFEMVDSYNNLFLEYQYLLFDIEECTDIYNDVIDCVKEKLSEIKLFDLKDNPTAEIERFVEEEHELIITQDLETLKWKFIYIRCADKEKFMDYVKYTQEINQ